MRSQVLSLREQCGRIKPVGPYWLRRSGWTSSSKPSDRYPVLMNGLSQATDHGTERMIRQDRPHHREAVGAGCRVGGWRGLDRRGVVTRSCGGGDVTARTARGRPRRVAAFSLLRRYDCPHRYGATVRRDGRSPLRYHGGPKPPDRGFNPQGNQTPKSREGRSRPQLRVLAVANAVPLLIWTS